MDGSLLRGAPATHITEPMKMELAQHWELIRFIIVQTMTVSVILGLAWLDKWGPTIWWEGGCQNLRIVAGRKWFTPLYCTSSSASGSGHNPMATGTMARSRDG